MELGVLPEDLKAGYGSTWDPILGAGRLVEAIRKDVSPGLEKCLGVSGLEKYSSHSAPGVLKKCRSWGGRFFDKLLARLPA
jgi:hypothetical protein